MHMLQLFQTKTLLPGLQLQQSKVDKVLGVDIFFYKFPILSLIFSFKRKRGNIHLQFLEERLLSEGPDIAKGPLCRKRSLLFFSLQLNVHLYPVLYSEHSPSPVTLQVLDCSKRELSTSQRIWLAVSSTAQRICTMVDYFCVLTTASNFFLKNAYTKITEQFSLNLCTGV